MDVKDLTEEERTLLAEFRLCPQKEQQQILAGLQKTVAATDPRQEQQEEAD